MRHRSGLLLMLASGFAGLGYQLVWAQQCALWLGHESAAVLAVVAAFFGGIALGALLLGRRIELSARPASWYAACELMIAAWALALMWLMAPFSDVLLTLTGPQASPLRQWLLAFGGTFMLLLPATMAMGATLPAIEAVMAREMDQMGMARRSIATWYASNTAGAVLGVLATAFWLVPSLGLSRTLMLCAVLNVLCAAAAWFVLRPVDRAWARGIEGKQWPAAGPPWRGHGNLAARRSVLWLLACTGLLGIGYEVLVVRVLSQVAEDTVYTFAMLLAVYLVGTAVGAAGYQKYQLHKDADESLTKKILGCLALACLLGTCSLWAAQWWQTALRSALGPGMAAALGAEAGTALLAFALPTVIMGALFSHLGAQALAQGMGFGQALGVNTLGAALAPLLFGVGLAPAMGPKWALLLLCAAYAGLGMWRGKRAGTSAPAWPWVLPAVIALAIAVLAPPLAFVTVPDGGRIVRYEDGVMAAVSVVEDSDGVARLRINNRQQEGSSATLMVDGRQALLPMLMHPAPHRALFLGLGTGVTAGVAAEDPSLRVDAVELLPEVIAASRHFAGVFDREAASDRLHVVAADARRYVRASTERHDLIVADNFQPVRSGSGALYTVEHFRAVKARLDAGGLFCQWLPLHQLDLATLRHIVRSFMQIYPHGMAILANNSLETPTIGLLGHHDDAPSAGLLDVNALRQRLAHNTVWRTPAAFGIPDEFALLGSLIAGPEALTHFASTVRANTDDLPVVAYKAPRITYAPQSSPAERLLALLDEWTVSPREVLVLPPDDSAFATRLDHYWAARKRFIQVGQGVQPTGDVRAMLAQVRAPLLDVLRLSADFRPAYEPLLGMAMALAQQGDKAGARSLLNELMSVQPNWPEARQALQQLP